MLDAFEDRPFEDRTDGEDAWWPNLLYIAVNKLLFIQTCLLAPHHFLNGDSSGLWCHPVDRQRIRWDGKTARGLRTPFSPERERNIVNPPAENPETCHQLAGAEEGRDVTVTKCCCVHMISFYTDRIKYVYYKAQNDKHTMFTTRLPFCTAL